MNISSTSFIHPATMWNDVEARGLRPRYPMMQESLEPRWSFIRKVYPIITIQLLATVAVASVVVFVHSISHFFVSSSGGLALYIVLMITPFIVLCPLFYYRQKCPVNYVLLGIFTISLAFAVGLTCAFAVGTVTLQAGMLTAVVVLSLTFYTFWAARRGPNFNFLGLVWFGALMVLMIFALIKILFPLGKIWIRFLPSSISSSTLVISKSCPSNQSELGSSSSFFNQRAHDHERIRKISVMIYGCLAAIILCGCIVYDTDKLIKRYSYDEYIWVAVSLYLDVINLILALLTIFESC